MLWIGADWLSWRQSQEDVANSVRSTRWCLWQRPNDDAKSSRNIFMNGTTERKWTAPWYARHCRRTPTCTTDRCCSLDHSMPWSVKIRAHSTSLTTWRYICAICFQVMKFWNKIGNNTLYVSASILTFIHISVQSLLSLYLDCEQMSVSCPLFQSLSVVQLSFWINVIYLFIYLHSNQNDITQ